MNIFSVINSIVSHPANRHGKSKALGRFLRWQILSKLAYGSMVVPFVDNTRLLVSRGMTGATGNIYNALLEWQEMSFTLHFLRNSDLFVDIGANVGVYSVLASGAVGARSLAAEPIPSTFQSLKMNIALNDLQDRVELWNVGLGADSGTLKFVDQLDTMNRVATPDELGISIPVRKLDDILAGRVPKLIKIDVEGYEYSVLRGAHETMRSPECIAAIVEVNGQEARYGHPTNGVTQFLRDLGFSPVSYNPRSRSVTSLERVPTGNGIFVKDIAVVKERILSSSKYATAAGWV